MADTLCGPSNALQSFQKHTSVDRTLQQDRLVGRHSPSQGFRSSSGQPAVLDAEFEAFQAGHAAPLHQSQDFHHLPPSHFAHPQTQSAHPDWASDFHRLNLASTHTPAAIKQHRPPVPNAPPAWHRDFIEQQAASTQASPFQRQQPQHGFMGTRQDMGGFAQPNFQHGMGFTGLNGNLSTNVNMSSSVAQGKQKVQERVLQYDEAAFEQAFAQAQQDMAHEEARVNTQPISAALDDHHSRTVDAEKLANKSANAQAVAEEEVEERALQRLREQRPGVYAALRIRNAIDTGKISDTERYFDFMESLEKSSTLIQDASEGQWIADTLRKVAAQGYSQESTMRAESLVRAVNERLMSTYPLLSSSVPINSSELWEELEAAGYVRSPAPENTEQRPQRSEQKPPPLSHNNDEMAKTAAQLLERVADNTSSKFRNSQFLQLMRRLRDREVRVEGDKMVEANETSASFSSSGPSLEHALPPQPIPSSAIATSTTTLPTSSNIPPIDPGILNHADTDFALPISSPLVNDEADTDDDQFSY